MATLLHSESRRLYSWWWDSHISPKNSKWLQENLTDMDAKVKAMIKLIEEDADSFARRAEMYYKKRPELMKLVEEFYRAYRALAERYDHATGELRQAHRTMAEAFPNQVSFALTEDSPSGSSTQETEPHTPELPHPICALLDPDDLDKHALGLSGSGISKKGLKQLHEMFGEGEVLPRSSKFSEGRVQKGLKHDMEEKAESLHNEVSKLSNENQNLKAKVLSESERAFKAESEVQNLKRALDDIQAEKEAVLLRYQQSLEKLFGLEGELNRAQKDFNMLNEQSSKAETEVLTLKEALVNLKAERETGFIKLEECLERISCLEDVVSHAQEDATEAEIEAQSLKNEISKLESEKEAVLLQYKQCLEKVSYLENIIAVAEEEARLLNVRADTAETEVKKLTEVLAKLKEEKEVAALQYERCLEKISKLENKLFCTQEDVKRLNNEILMGSTKLKSSEEKCIVLEMSNHSLRLEADNLVKKITLKDQELSEKHGELEKLQICVQDEHLRYVQVEATLQALQKLHSQSQEEQRALALELKNGLHMLKDLEISKHVLEEEIRRVKDENWSLNELNSSSTILMGNLQDEILSLRKMKEKLEEEVAIQLGRSDALQQEIFHLKEEIKGLNMSYRALMEQVEFVGLNPKFFGSSVKELQDENSMLKQICEKERDGKEALFKKLETMEELLEKNGALQSSLSDVNGELEGSKEKVKTLQESCQFLKGEKSHLVAEKAALLSQLQIITENMQKLLEKNTLLENSLSGANVELEGLRAKSKSLEELFQLVSNEKSNLLTERSTLVVQLENVEQRLGNLEKRFTEFEEKYAGLEKEKESTHSQIEELRFSLGVEKQERASLTLWSENRLATLENHINLLQEESRWGKRDFQEELDKAVIAQFEIFLLQKFIQDMEEKNYSLLIEFQKHIEASKLSDQLISELESENLEQQVEAELLLVEIEKLRLGIRQVFKALETGPASGSTDKIENEQIFVHHILEDIENMKCSLSKYKDDKQQLLVENSVLLTLVDQLRLEGLEIESEKKNLDRAIKTMKEQFEMEQTEKQELLEMNRRLRSEVSKGDQQANILKAEVESLCVKQDDLQRVYVELQEENSQTLEENRSLLKQFSDLKEEKCIVEEENNAIVLETLALGNLSTILKSIGTENTEKFKLLSEDLYNLHGVNSDLEKEVIILRGKVEMNELENLDLKCSVDRLEMELSGVRDFNDGLKQEISNGKDFLSQRDIELFEAEQKLKETENMNSDLCKTVEGLKRECEESKLVRENSEMHILKLSKDNGKLESKLGMLREEIEERRIREENLSSEMQERSNEFELWEDEAATFYFDLHISAIREVLFEDKVHELTRVCESLEGESASKTQEIEQIMERVSSKESEIRGLNAQLLAYAPVIVSLKDNVASLEHNTLSLTKLIAADNQKPKVEEVPDHPHEESFQELMEDQNSPLPCGISDLQKLQTSIKAVEKVVLEEVNRIVRQESLRTNFKLETAMREIEELKSQCSSGQLEVGDYHPKLQKTKPEISESKIRVLMKDIPLDQAYDGSSYGIRRRGYGGPEDQMLELWETSNELQKQAYEPMEDDDIVYHQFEDVEQKIEDVPSVLKLEKDLGVDKLEVPKCTTVPNQGRNKGKILKRLASDAQKLVNLQTTVQDLRRKMEMNKNFKKAKDFDFHTVNEQLQEVEETVVELVDLNGRLTKNIEEGPAFSEGKALGGVKEAVNVRRKRVLEEARKGSEKIGRLQMEVQKIQYVVLKVEDEKKSKGKSRFSRTRSRTSIILKDFIYSGRRGGSAGRRKKAYLCGCFRPSTNGDGNHF